MRRVVIRLPNWLGDTLLARPLLHALARGLPHAERVAVGPAPLLSLLWSDGAFSRGEAWPADGAGRAALARRLRKFEPDAAWILPPSFSSALFAWRIGARVRVGYRHELRSPLLTVALTRPQRGEMHLAAEYQALAAAGMGGASPSAASIDEVPLLRPSEAGAAAAERLLASRGITTPPAILGPGAIYGPAKRWPADRFADLGRRLARRGFAVLVCGAAAERDTCDAVARAVGPGAHALAGETDLASQAALCARAGIVVCNDSGLAHLAAATGAPTVTIFGSTSSAWTAPLGPRVAVVQDAPVCSPCFRRTCRIGTLCLAAVTVARVERACADLAVGAAA